MNREKRVRFSPLTPILMHHRLRKPRTSSDNSFAESAMYKNYQDQLACQRKHYRNNSQGYLDRNKKRTGLFREIIVQSKNKPCADCGQSFPSYVMDFDHRDDKKFTISRINMIASESALRIEIEKCDVVCANCHRERTHQRSLLPDGVIGNTRGFEPCR